MTEKMRRITIAEFQQMGNKNLDGQIVEFIDGLYLYGYEKDRKEGDKTIINPFPKVKTAKPVGKFMRVSGGFGSSFACSGRMIMGTYYETLHDAINDKPVEIEGYKVSSTTKEYPDFVWI